MKFSELPAIDVVRVIPIVPVLRIVLRVAALTDRISPPVLLEIRVRLLKVETILRRGGACPLVEAVFVKKLLFGSGVRPTMYATSVMADPPMITDSSFC